MAKGGRCTPLCRPPLAAFSLRRIRPNRPPILSQLRRNRRVALQSSGELAERLDGGAADVPVWHEQDGVRVTAGLGDLASELLGATLKGPLYDGVCLGGLGGLLRSVLHGSLPFGGAVDVRDSVSNSHSSRLVPAESLGKCLAASQVFWFVPREVLVKVASLAIHGTSEGSCDCSGRFLTSLQPIPDHAGEEVDQRGSVGRLGCRGACQLLPPRAGPIATAIAGTREASQLGYGLNRRLIFTINARFVIVGKPLANPSRCSLNTMKNSLPGWYSHRSRTFALTTFVAELY